MIHYLPGCDVRKNHPEVIEKLTHYMESKGAFIDQCCRTTKRLLEKNDTIVNNCTMCQIILEETHSENEIMSIYEYILNDKDFPWSNHKGERITIQDCWRTRNNRAMLDAIRECLKRMNFTIVEMEENYELTTFDGVWLYNQPSPICLKVAPITFGNIVENYVHPIPENQQEEKMIEWVKQYTTDRVVVYCNGCERGIKIGKGHPIHLVELLAENL